MQSKVKNNVPLRNASTLNTTLRILGGMKFILASNE